MFNFLFHFLYFLVTLAIALFFIALGSIGMALPWSAIVRTELIQFILENSLAIGLFGFGFFVVGMILIINLFLNSKHRYYYVRAGKKAVAVDESVIRHYVSAYWDRLFPSCDIPTHLTLRKNKIKIVADLPYTPLSEQKNIVAQVQKELHEILTHFLGKPPSLTLALSFQTANRIEKIHQ